MKHIKENSMIWTCCILVMLLMSYLYLVFKFLPQLESATYLSDIRFPNEIQQGIVAKMAANQKALLLSMQKLRPKQIG